MLEMKLGWSRRSLDDSDLRLWVPAPVRNCALGGDDQQRSFTLLPLPLTRPTSLHFARATSPRKRGEVNESISTWADWADSVLQALPAWVAARVAAAAARVEPRAAAGAVAGPAVRPVEDAAAVVLRPSPVAPAVRPVEAVAAAVRPAEAAVAARASSPVSAVALSKAAAMAVRAAPARSAAWSGFARQAVFRARPAQLAPRGNSAYPVVPAAAAACWRRVLPKTAARLSRREQAARWTWAAPAGADCRPAEDWPASRRAPSG
jgi:hypothetical protein